MEQYETSDAGSTPAPLSPVSVRQLLLQAGLFLLTFFTTTIAGVQWIGLDPFELGNFSYGLPYSLSLLFILTVHEFGHYVAARAHGVDVTLPYYIPFPPIPTLFQLFLNFGTFGAVIRTRSMVPSRRAIFDIGVAGPIAGFLASVGILIYGFTHLPGPEYISAIHPGYDIATHTIPNSDGLSLGFGRTLLYTTLEQLFTNPAREFVPPMTEIYHYPYLCTGWFGLFVTAMNLIPMGQFDGGHVTYAMFGDGHRRIARWSFYGLLLLAAPSVSDSLLRLMLGFVTGAEIPQIVPLAEHSWSAWFIWALVAFYVVKLYHPPLPDETPLDDRRTLVGWLTLAILVLSFSHNPFQITLP